MVGLEGLPILLLRKLADFAGILVLKSRQFVTEAVCKVAMETFQDWRKKSNFASL